MIANGAYGMSVITALTAQNTTGVSAIVEPSPEFSATADRSYSDRYTSRSYQDRHGIEQCTH